MPPDFSRDVHCLLGLPFDAITLAQAEQQVRSAAITRTPFFFSTPNLNFLIASKTDTAFRDSVLKSDLSIADGAPVVWMARMLGIPIPERVAGSDLFDKLQSSQATPLRIYFFGAKAGVAEIACRKLNATASGLTCVGFESPGFGSVDELSSDISIARINASCADFVVVSLGAKKGQAWIERNRHRLNAPVISHLGAVVNFVASTVSRAPIPFQRIGLEWVWRIKEEPELWRRYFNDGVGLLGLLASRVLPGLILRMIYKPSAAQLDAASVSLIDGPRRVTIRLAGAWSRHNLDKLRTIFQNAASMQKNIVFDMSETVHIDSAFIGLLMLLSGYQKHQGRTLQLTSVSKSIYRIFKYSGSDYLCDIHDQPAFGG